MNFLDEFVRELNRSQPRIERLALLIAGIAYPELEVAHSLSRIDQLAERVEMRLLDHWEAANLARLFLDVLHDELGFAGNSQDYYHPDNSYLNIVLERRTGLPILLCLLCVVIGRRLGLLIDGVGFPGHFMARMTVQGADWLLDPFNDLVISPEQAPAHLAKIFGQQISLPLNDDAYRPVTPEAWAQRILFNLRNVYLGQQNEKMTIRVLDYLLEIMPNHGAMWRERGLLHYQLENVEQALFDLRRSFFLFDQFVWVWGSAEERQAALPQLGSEERQVVQLYYRLLEMQTRYN